MHWLLHTLAMRAGVNREPGLIVHAEPDHRPPVVATRLKTIQLVAALWSVLVRPHVAGFRMNRDSLHIAVAVTPDLRLRPVALHEWVVFRNPPIVVEPNYLAVMVGKILRGVRLEVTDNGPGVPPEELARLGERFHRLPGAAESGSGLGLSIVLRIAELHRGRVRFAAGPDDRGLEVAVELPRK